MKHFIATSKIAYALVMTLCLSLTMQSQTDSINYKMRKCIVTTTVSGVTAVSYIGLNHLWYKGYPQSPFHFFNDNDEWLQMDKAGHTFSAYSISDAMTHAYKWAGVSDNKSACIASAIGFTYLGCIELLDAKSEQWGFSWGDILANTSGSLIHLTQELLWKEQRVRLKFSYSPTPFAEYNPNALGRNFQQRLLKDYNGQTYWASANIHSFLAPDAGFPRWLNIAFGYGASGMMTAKMNDVDVNNFQRTREFYFSFDADLSRIRWKKKWMRTTAQILNFIKIPSPTFELRENGKMKVHGLFF